MYEIECIHAFLSQGHEDNEWWAVKVVQLLPRTTILDF